MRAWPQTSYSYDEQRRWLDSICTQTAEGSTLQGISYSFDLVGNILQVSNTATAFGWGYSTTGSYAYDALDQLVQASGTLTKTVSSRYPWRSEGWHTQYSSTYTQSYAYDALGNLTRKISTESCTPRERPWEELDYDLSYQYYEGKVHQAERIGNFWYRYDEGGNLVQERRWGHGGDPVEEPWVGSSGELGMANRGFGLAEPQDSSQAEQQREASLQGKPGYGEASGRGYWQRQYFWDEENRLLRTVEQGGLKVEYRYGADGQRAVKYSAAGETLYFDSMWTGTADWPNGWRWSKHIYVGSTRIATRLGYDGRERDLDYKRVNTYYYHTDHLGSVHLVSDYQGKVYEHIEYTPYGELWVEHGPQGLEAVPYRFTGKELDTETGLYYYGARYLNLRTSRWISPDPALPDYLPGPGTSASDLPGGGGVFRPTNLSVYHYAANNPLRYVDPSGQQDELADISAQIQATERLFGQYFHGERGDPSSPENKAKIGQLHGQLMGLYGQYNKAVLEKFRAQGGLSVGEYLPGGLISKGGEFGVPQDLGVYQTTAHPGIDIVGQGSLQTPFYTKFGGVPRESGSNPFELEIVGTDLKLSVLHSDPDTLMGTFFKPGQAIVPFPTRNNDPNSSTGPHFHVQMSNGRQFFNPLTLQPAGTNFQWSRNRGATWRRFIP